MDTLIGTLLTCSLVIGYGGLVLVGLADTPEPPLNGQFSVIAWDGDNDGAAEGARLDVHRISQDRAKVRLHLNGASWERIIEAGSEVYIPCPEGDRWLVVESGENVVTEHRIPPCAGGGAWGAAEEAPKTPIESTEEGGGTCPKGYRILDSFVCLPLHVLEHVKVVNEVD